MSKRAGMPGMRGIAKRKGFKPYKKSVPSNKTLNKKIKKIQRNTEVKHFDVLVTGASMSTTGVFQNLIAIPVGDTDNTRTGNDLAATSIRCRWIATQVAATAVANNCRIIIGWDSQPNTGPSTADLLDTSVITNPLVAPYNADNQKRFKILYDRSFTLNPKSGVSGTVIPDLVIRKMKKSLSRMVKYNDAGGSVTNNLFLWRYADVAPAGNNPLLTFGTRFNFKDA